MESIHKIFDQPIDSNNYISENAKDELAKKKNLPSENFDRRKRIFDQGIDLNSYISENAKDEFAKTKNIPSEYLDRCKRFKYEAENTFKEKRENIWSNEREKFMSDVPRFKSSRIDTPEGCIHEVILSEGMYYKPMVHGPDYVPARNYPFVLDPFQREAIDCIENNQSVLVSAHTSAGKTVVAEFAIAQSLKNKQRVVYTTPIKALSNQKYMDLKLEFGDVGLMTGDITIDPMSKVIVMTTEILRTYLYNGTFMGKEPSWIIFDEIHYMRDKERGVAWEESIILMKPHMRCVFLSATIPNAKQFAEWICNLHRQPCHVVYTEFRPTPLMHYVYPEGGNGIYLVMDEKGTFRDDNLNEAVNIVKDAGDAAKDQKGRKGGFVGDSNCLKLVKMIVENKFAPVIVFSFSKKDCEAYAIQTSKLDFNSDGDKKEVNRYYNAAILYLSEENRKLPQVEQFLPLALRGIGIHHSGLLPIMRELTEILFEAGFIKVLFTTETFAMGLNMPARTVLFTGVRKFDGNEFRWLTSGEYIQMSGRAGRRGLDDKGIVIMMMDQKMTTTVAKEMITGKSDPLNSAYRLTYNMVAQSLMNQSVTGLTPDHILKMSFLHFQSYPHICSIYDRLVKAEEKYFSFVFDDENEAADYYFRKEQIQFEKEKLIPFIQKPDIIAGFLVKGRMIKVAIDGFDHGWCPVVSYKMPVQKYKSKNMNRHEDERIEVLLDVEPNGSRQGCMGEGKIACIKFDNIISISIVQVKLPEKLKHSDDRAGAILVVKKILEKFPKGLPEFGLAIKNEEFVNIYDKMKGMEDALKSHSFIVKEKSLDTFEMFKQREKLYDEMKTLENELKEKKALLKMDELKKKKWLLRKLKYINKYDVLLLKGHVLREITCGDELVLTELLLDGFFNNLSSEEICSVLSCFAFQEKQKDPPKLTQALKSLHKQVQDKAHLIAEQSKYVGLEMDADEYVDSFTPDIMHIIYAWASKYSFPKLCEMTSIYEGSIFRCIRRLRECLCEMQQATRTIGTIYLECKFIAGIPLILRDIMYTESLYR